MKKKLVFSTITLMSCLAILFGAIITLPKLSHAAAPSNYGATNTTTATISVSPINLPTSNCTPLTHNTPPSSNSLACPVTITLNKSVLKGLHWTVSYSATICSYTGCQPDNSDFAIAIFRGESTLYKSGDTAQIFIIGPDSEFHAGINATFVFSGPTNKVKVQYQPPSYY